MTSRIKELDNIITLQFLIENERIQSMDILQLSRIAHRPKLPSEGSDRRAMLDCNSAEWCILAYLYDLSCNCTILRAREKFTDLKRLFSTQCEPSNSTCNLSDKKFGVDYIANPKKKVDPLTIKLLSENPQNQYNLVCNFLMEVCECNDTDKLNDIAILCCEFTAQCNSLSAGQSLHFACSKLFKSSFRNI